jgi:hypothetical protein
MSKSDLVLLKESTGDIQDFIKNSDFLKIVNSNPPQAFVKDHPIAKGVKYVPIDKVELMLDTIFQQWYPEVLKTGQLLNAIEVTVRVHYLHPVSKEWQFVDGVGAVAIQTDQGKSAADLAAVKSNAVMLALPAAKSYAIKDAVEHIGKLFGRDLNRKDTMAFSPSQGTEEAKAEIADKKQELRDRLAKAREAKKGRA